MDRPRKTTPPLLLALITVIFIGCSAEDNPIAENRGHDGTSITIPGSLSNRPFIVVAGMNTLAFFDMETVDGRAEGAFYDVHAIPTTIIRQNGRDVARWEGEVPDSAELKGLFIGKA